MSKNVSLWGANYSNVPALNVPQTGGGTARFTDTSPTTAVASDVATGKVFFLSDGTQATGTASGGADIPVFTVTMTTEYVSTAISCNKTYSQINAVMPNEMSGYVQFSTPSETWACPAAARYDDYYSPTCIIWRIMNSGGMPDYEFAMYPNGTITLPVDANFAEDLRVTQNGVYFPSDSLHKIGKVTVEVPAGGSLNTQVAQSTTRATSSTYTQLISLTCTVAGTYDVYWSTFRSSTSGTWGSQLYLGSTAYGSAQTGSWSNHIQNIHLTGVQISANQTVSVRVRTRGNNYYGYVGTLTIKQTS